MIERIVFENVKALRDATLPLTPFTLLVGPNGSGKTTAVEALRMAWNPGGYPADRLVSVGQQLPIRLMIHWGPPHGGCVTITSWRHPKGVHIEHRHEDGTPMDGSVLLPKLAAIRIFNLDAGVIAQPVALEPNVVLAENGRGLVGVIEQLRDSHPERFESLNNELGRLLPEFDRILFTTPAAGHKGFQLRTRKGSHAIEASDLSQGTLLAVAILTLAYLPTPPTLIAVEEPNRGIHPRLLRDIHDALYRLSHPSEFGDDRDPVQVIATTHSPYLLDLFREHPEDVVIANKKGNWATFEKLTEQKDADKILSDSHLGDAWYSGILGGVPVEE